MMTTNMSNMDWHVHMWKWVAADQTRTKSDWFKEFYDGKPLPRYQCFACEEAYARMSEVVTNSATSHSTRICHYCPICNYDAGSGCLNGLYDAYLKARAIKELGISGNIARAIANLKWY